MTIYSNSTNATSNTYAPLPPRSFGATVFVRCTSVALGMSALLLLGHGPIGSISGDLKSMLAPVATGTTTSTSQTQTASNGGFSATTVNLYGPSTGRYGVSK